MRTPSDSTPSGQWPPEASETPYRVLMVDDEPITLEIHSSLLSSAGMIVETLEEARLTLDKIEVFRPDVLLLDFYMPDITGLELVAQLRKEESLRHLPIIFLSGEFDQDIQLDALNQGGDEFLTKPVKPRHLLGRVSALARRSRESRNQQAQLEKLVYEREREHQALNHHAIVSIADRAGKITYVNDLFCQISGYTSEELLGQNHRLLKSNRHPQSFYEDMWATIASGQVWRGEVCNRRKDGSFYWVESTITPFMDAKGKPYQYVSIRTDVTHLKAAEEEAERAKNSLLIFSRLVDAADQGIRVSDAKGHLIYVNSAYEQLVGLSKDEILGKHFTEFFTEEGLKWAPDAIREAFKQGKNWSGLLPVKRPDGSEFTATSNVGFIKDATGELQYMFNIISDFSDELRRQQQLADAKEEAERANQAKSEFLSSMSHELRTPMNAILGFAQILEYDDELSEDNQENIHEIIKAGKHLLELINEVLDLAKVESGHLTLSLEKIELAPVIDEVLALIQSLAKKRQIEIQQPQTDLGPLHVRADRTRLKQVLLNLLSNAVKYNREAGQITLEFEHPSPERLRILVSDTGEGIPEDQLAGLFEPFNRLNAEESETEGTGIGLTITRRIMEKMDGSVDVTSEVGAGSTFWLELPLESAEETDAANSPESLEAVLAANSDTLPSGRKKQVLYIEDNPANLRLVSSIFNRLEQAELVTAHLPQLGLDIARSNPPDLILLDINMPGMNGFQVLEALRQDARLKKIPVLAVTANAMPKDKERGKQAGFNDYITKPLQIPEFIDSVNFWLKC